MQTTGNIVTRANFTKLIEEVGNIKRFFADGYAVIKDGHLLDVHGRANTINNARYYKHQRAGLEFANKHGGQLIAVKNLILRIGQPVNKPQFIEATQ